MVAFWKECKMTKQTFDDLINQINTVSKDVQRERGTLFEKLTLAYLKNEPTYKALYQNVWLLSEVPESYGIPKKDTGVDLVAEQKNGDLVAIQAKKPKSVPFLRFFLYIPRMVSMPLIVEEAVRRL